MQAPGVFGIGIMEIICILGGLGVVAIVVVVALVAAGSRGRDDKRNE